MSKGSFVRLSKSILSQKILRYSLFSLWVIVFLALPASAQTTTPRFGSELVFLKPMEEHASASDLTLLHPVEMSPSGRFVAGTVYYPTDGYQEWVYYFYLWDLAGFEPDGKHSSPPPTQILDLGAVTMPGAFIAVSPDEHYVALNLDTQLQIMTLPELAIYRTITVAERSYYETPRVFWSPDSRYVFFKDGTEVVTMDNHTGEIFRRYRLKGDYALHTFGDEWLLRSFDVSSRADYFFICSYWFEQCTSYEYHGREQILSPNRKTIATIRIENESISLLWTQQADGRYMVEEGSIAPGHLDWIYRVSPSGRYLMLGIDEGSQIWDLDTSAPIQTFPHGNPEIWLINTRATWLAKDEFFVAYVEYHDTPGSRTSEVWLYQLGQDIPLDIIEFSSLRERENIVGDSEAFGVRNVSDDGRWVIYGLGGGAMVIPIVYE